VKMGLFRGMASFELVLKVLSRRAAVHLSTCLLGSNKLAHNRHD
jgi:hypothetical protein